MTRGINLNYPGLKSYLNPSGQKSRNMLENLYPPLEPANKHVQLKKELPDSGQDSNQTQKGGE